MKLILIILSVMLGSHETEYEVETPEGETGKLYTMNQYAVGDTITINLP